MRRTPVYGLNLGDMTHSEYWYSKNYSFPQYIEAMKDVDFPVFHAIGNHDYCHKVADDTADAQYKAALAEETATVIAYNYVPLTDSAPVRAAVKKMQAGEDAELRYYNFYDRNDCQGIDGMRLTVKDGVAAFQEASLTGYGDTVDWENVLYQQAGEIRLNSCGELSIIDSVDYIYEVFSPLDTYEDYNKRYELTKTYLYPLAEGCTQNFTSPEGITDPLWWARLCWFLTDGETDYPEGHEVPIDEIEEVLLKWFDISEETLRSLLDPDGNGTMLWVTETGISWSCFAKEAVREGDLLRIRYGFTFNGREPNYNRELTVRIAEDGSWKYVSNRTVPTELENGVTAMSIDGMLSGSGWQPLYTCPVPEGDGYNEVFSTTMSPRLLADGTMAIPVIRGDYEDGKTIAVVLLRLDAAYLRRQVTAELLVPDKPVIQGEDFTLTVRLRNRSRLPIPALVVLLNAADELSLIHI